MSFRVDEGNIKIHPSFKNIEPSLFISFRIRYSNYGVLPYMIKGELLIDQKRIAILSEILERRYSNSVLRKPLDRKDDDFYDLNLEADLTEKAIDAINHSRDKNQGDVKFTIKINVQFLETNIAFSNSDRNKLHWNQDEWNPVYLNKYSNYLLEKKIETVIVSKSISSSDWVKQFIPILKIGKFLTYEIPLITTDGIGEKFKERINSAIESIEVMENARRQCEWNLVIKEARPIIELINHKNEIIQLFRNEGFEEEAINKFVEMLLSFFHYVSKFIHRVSQNKNLLKISSAQKEDAEFVYAMAVNLVNLISRKSFRQES